MPACQHVSLFYHTEHIFSLGVSEIVFLLVKFFPSFPRRILATGAVSITNQFEVGCLLMMVAAFFLKLTAGLGLQNPEAAAAAQKSCSPIRFSDA